MSYCSCRRNWTHRTTLSTWLEPFTFVSLTLSPRSNRISTTLSPQYAILHNHSCQSRIKTLVGTAATTKQEFIFRNVFSPTFPWYPFPFPTFPSSFPFSVFFPSPRSGPLNPARGLSVECCKLSQCISGVYRTQRTSLSAVNVVPFLLNKIWNYKADVFFGISVIFCEILFRGHWTP